MADQGPPSGSAASCIPIPSRSDYATNDDYRKALDCFYTTLGVVKSTRDIVSTIEPVMGQSFQNLSNELSNAEEALKTWKKIPSRNEAFQDSVADVLASASSDTMEIVDLWEDFISKANAVLEKTSVPDEKAVPDTPFYLMANPTSCAARIILSRAAAAAGSIRSQSRLNI
ncbi:hypothetical protein PG991_010634 [Apiospora marii]|uniref:Uncharacterized protein n=1 Tax=Apiospora marii TaxID=335849 RepID=A0ABR1RBX8_9PEZI